MYAIYYSIFMCSTLLCLILIFIYLSYDYSKIHHSTNAITLYQCQHISKQVPLILFITLKKVKHFFNLVTFE